MQGGDQAARLELALLVGQRADPLLQVQPVA